MSADVSFACLTLSPLSCECSLSLGSPSEAPTSPHVPLALIPYKRGCPSLAATVPVPSHVQTCSGCVPSQIPWL